jgi:cell wall-associated NlpC family hydrolase
MEPGDYGIVSTNGWAARLIQLVTRSRYNHAFVYVGNGQVIEGRPSGAGYNSLTAYPDVLWSTVPLNPLERDTIVRAAVGFIGTPYSWLDCAAIGLAHLIRLHVPTVVRRNLSWAWDPVKRRLRRVDRLECAQLVDLAYARAGVNLFADMRDPGDVAPSDLAVLALKGPS